MDNDTLRQSLLVSTDWLQEHLDDADSRLFDVTGCLDEKRISRGQELHYDLHHIPGAAYLDVASPQGEMADPEGRFPFTWPTPTQFSRTMQHRGVNNESLVILYGAPNPRVPGSGATWVTRAWWLMHHFGVNCRILDGGWEKWQSEGRPISTETTEFAPGNFRVVPDWERGCAGKGDVLRALGEDNRYVVDSLSEASYRGGIDQNYGTFGRRKGHITGAVNVDYEQLLDPVTGCYRSSHELRALFTNVGVNINRPIITYCGGGIGATSTGFALKLIGASEVAVYDASLMEWANDPTLPMMDLSKTG